MGRGLLDALRLQQIKAKDDDDDEDGIHRIMNKINYYGGRGAPPVRSGQDIATASTLVLEPQLDFRVGRLATFRSIDPTGCGSGWIDRLANAARSFITSYAVRPVVRLDSDRRVHEPLDAVRHLNEALATEHPIRRRWPMDASLQFAAQGLKAWGSDISKIRKAVVAEIWELKEEMAEQIDDWKSNLAPEVEQVFDQRMLCVPLYEALLNKFGYPDAGDLAQDCTNVFSLVGKLRGVYGGHLTSKRPPIPSQSFVP